MFFPAQTLQESRSCATTFKACLPGNSGETGYRKLCWHMLEFPGSAVGLLPKLVREFTMMWLWMG